MALYPCERRPRRMAGRTSGWDYDLRSGPFIWTSSLAWATKTASPNPIPSPIFWDRMSRPRKTITQANHLRVYLRQLLSDQTFAEAFIIPWRLIGRFLEHLCILLSG